MSSHSGTSLGASRGAFSQGSTTGTTLTTAALVPTFSSRRLSVRLSICATNVCCQCTMFLTGPFHSKLKSDTGG